MMAKLQRNAKIPNDTLEPATVTLIIEVVESLVATGTSGRSLMLLSLTVVAIEVLILYITVIKSQQYYSFSIPYIVIIIYDRISPRQ